MSGLVDGTGRAQALDCFPEDHQRNEHQGERVDECGQHAGASVPVGLAVVRGLALEIDRDGRQHQRERIGEVVAGVGNHGQAVRPDSRGDLRHHQHQRRGDRPLQQLSGSVMVVGVGHSCS